MSEPAFQITGLAPVLHVRDLAAALAYYRDRLGFDVTFTWEDPPRYACLCRGDAAVHLNAYQPPVANAIVCIFCKGVDALYLDLVARDATIARSLASQPYGMREFVVSDPDGHQLVFGEGIAE